MAKLLAQAFPSLIQLLDSVRVPACAITLPEEAGAIVRRSLTLLLIMCTVVAAFAHFLSFDLSAVLAAIALGTAVGGVALITKGIEQLLDLLSAKQGDDTLVGKIASAILPSPHAREGAMKWLVLLTAVSILSLLLFFAEAVLAYLAGADEEWTYTTFATLFAVTIGPLDAGRILQFALYAAIALAGLALFGRWKTGDDGGALCSRPLAASVTILLVGLLGAFLTSLGHLLFSQGT